MAIAEARILYADEYFLAVNKRSGELVVQGSGERGKLPLLDFLRKDYPGLHPVHRLDFETSGVVLFARSRPALAAMRGTAMRKTYHALVTGTLKRRIGDIRTPLPARASEGTVPALTRYRVLVSFGDVALVEAEILTGRQHQIRRHFAGIGHPLILDHVYGDIAANRKLGRSLGYRKFFLHASRLSFHHPFTGREITIEAPLPETFNEVLERLQ